jgi:HSP20 family protein
MAKDVELTRPERPARLWDIFDWPDHWLEAMRPWFGSEGVLRIEQELTDDTMVVRAEMPGIDPDKDVDITLSGGLLRIHAQRTSEKKEEEAGRTHSEFRYGSFERTLRIPNDVSEDDIKASYKDGILEVRVPFKLPTEAQPAQIAVTRS